MTQNGSEFSSTRVFFRRLFSLSNSVKLKLWIPRHQASHINQEEREKRLKKYDNFHYSKQYTLSELLEARLNENHAQKVVTFLGKSVFWMFYLCAWTAWVYEYSLGVMSSRVKTIFAFSTPFSYPAIIWKSKHADFPKRLQSSMIFLAIKKTRCCKIPSLFCFYFIWKNYCVFIMRFPHICFVLDLNRSCKRK